MPDSLQGSVQHALSMDGTAVQTLCQGATRGCLQDAPGTWQKHFSEQHSTPFFYNAQTQESRYSRPTSCAWQQGSLEGYSVYVNTITHQRSWTRPTALAWKYLHAPDQDLCASAKISYACFAGIGIVPMLLCAYRRHCSRLPVVLTDRRQAAGVVSDLPSNDAVCASFACAANDFNHVDCGCRYFWFNYVSGATVAHTPAELPNDMAKDIQYDSGSYWHNTASTTTQWADPHESEWRKMTDPDGNPFWFNPEVRSQGCSTCAFKLL